tara:strand:- start:758 stop:1072 length:315 start_codon:yes stop_codon:yes gene_type:complete
MSKYINTDIAINNKLSRTAHALVLPLMLLSNQNNEINKIDFTKMVGWITDYRTWDKYWKELVSKGVLVRLGKDKWMVSPHECYTDGTSHTILINKWNEARNAIN